MRGEGGHPGLSKDGKQLPPLWPPMLADGIFFEGTGFGAVGSARQSTWLQIGSTRRRARRNAASAA